MLLGNECVILCIVVGALFENKAGKRVDCNNQPTLFDSLEYRSRLITIPCLVGQGVSKTCQNKCKQEECMYI